MPNPSTLAAAAEEMTPDDEQAMEAGLEKLLLAPLPLFPGEERERITDRNIGHREWYRAGYRDCHASEAAKRERLENLDTGESSVDIYRAGYRGPAFRAGRRAGYASRDEEVAGLKAQLDVFKDASLVAQSAERAVENTALRAQRAAAQARCAELEKALEMSYRTNGWPMDHDPCCIFSEHGRNTEHDCDCGLLEALSTLAGGPSPLALSPPAALSPTAEPPLTEAQLREMFIFISAFRARFPHENAEECMNKAETAVGKARDEGKIP